MLHNLFVRSKFFRISFVVESQKQQSRETLDILGGEDMGYLSCIIELAVTNNEDRAMRAISERKSPIREPRGGRLFPKTGM
jgi:hypothetical protein